MANTAYRIEEYFDRLWPINRSLTGDGNRQSLHILSEIVDLKTTEVPSGSKALDWTVPPEWNARAAWIKDQGGNIVVDFKDNNLHLLGYSIPIHKKMEFEELKQHLHTLPELPDLIPYVTSYYKERWGFCMSQNQFDTLDPTQTYEVFIDSTLDYSGNMTVAEAFLSGESEEEILISTYICHPSMANNELSGPLVTAFLYDKLRQEKNLKYSYRFLFAPETIGTLYHLSQYGNHWKGSLKAGFVVNCAGTDAPFKYKKSRMGNAIVDKASEFVLNLQDTTHKIIDFFPRGSDERQYCSPGFNLPVGVLMRSMYQDYPEYHTSGDNKDLVSFEAMEKTVNTYFDIIMLIEKNEYYINQKPYGEPQLGKLGLYPSLGSASKNNTYLDNLMWVLNLTDGEHDLIDIAEKGGIALAELYDIIEKLKEKELVKPK